jgi:hypothetical protein
MTTTLALGEGASKALLEADCFYEYACESRRLRCLFVLISATRKRRDFEPCSFDGLLEEDARRSLAARFIGSLVLPIN